jgi:hypothetical protein
MASKPETNFIRRIHKILPRSIYYEKMYNPLRRGTPDVWYSGVRSDCWVEYKYVPKLPAQLKADELLSSLQHKWICDRLEEGRNVWVVIGSPVGALIYQPDRDRPLILTREEFYKRAVSDNRVAIFLGEQVT